uniref:CFA20 domain-containing protein n=1 Tax=Heliothis virescens TaxID=7102 RepID=A0A2A4K6B0_HELVI
MFRKAYQRGVFTIFFSIGSKPLAIWDTFTEDGYIKRFVDDDIKSMILEIGGTNVSTTYMVCPKGDAILGIGMPFLVMVVKNLKKYFSFEVTILDDTGTRRRFRISNFQSTTQVLPLCTVMPIGLSDGWNQIQFNLAEFTRRAYKKQFVEVQKVKINANIRLRRIYFADRLVSEDQLPPDYRLFYNLKRKPLDNKDKITNTEIKQEKVTEIIIDQEKVDEPNQAEQRISTVSKGKGSMQVIKVVSGGPGLDVISRLIEVPEEIHDLMSDETNMEPEPLLQADHSTTALIKEVGEFLKEPSMAVVEVAERSESQAETGEPEVVDQDKIEDRSEI